MSVETTAGTSFSVCVAAPATYDLAGYGALAWTEAGEVTDLGAFGRIYQLITHKPIKTRGTKKIKGSFDEGKIPLQYGYDFDDGGQLIIDAAVLSDDPISVRVVSQSGKVFYMRVLVMGAPLSFGDSDKVVTVSADMEITTSDSGVGIVKG